MDPETGREEAEDLRVEDVEPSGEGTEGRQDEASVVADETAPNQSAGTQPYHRCGMKMPADLATWRPARRPVSEDDSVYREFVDNPAAKMSGRCRIMITGDPHPVMCRDEACQEDDVARAQSFAGVAVMEAVAETDHRLSAMPPQHGDEPLEAGAGIIGRQQRAMSGKARPLLEMKVGDDDRSPARP